MKGPLVPGDVIRGWRILEPIGAGAFAQVYRCQHEITQAIAALKTLLPTRMQNADTVDSFLQEGTALANINHPHILRVHDVGTEGGVVFMIMDLLTGKTLGECLRATGRFSVPLALHLFVQLCAALSETHYHEMIHRDLKPQNLMVRGKTAADKLRLVVFDFGISKVYGSAVASTDRLQTLRGSIAYMSPEALSSKPPTTLFDIYSAGVVLFEMLAGRHPRQELLNDPMELGQVTMVEQAPNIRHFVPGLPEDVAVLVDKTLAKRPEWRFQTAGELGQAAELALIRFGQDVLAGRRRYVQPPLEAEIFEYVPGAPPIDPKLWELKRISIPRYDRSMAAEVMASVAQHAALAGKMVAPSVSATTAAADAPSAPTAVANTGWVAERGPRNTIRLAADRPPDPPAPPPGIQRDSSLRPPDPPAPPPGVQRDSSLRVVQPDLPGAKRWLVVTMLIVAVAMGSGVAWWSTNDSSSARASNISPPSSAPSPESAPSSVVPPSSAPSPDSSPSSVPSPAASEEPAKGDAAAEPTTPVPPTPTAPPEPTAHVVPTPTPTQQPPPPRKPPTGESKPRAIEEKPVWTQ